MDDAKTAGLNRSNEHFPCPDGFSTPAYISRPAGPGRVPGVLFIHEMFGMNDEMKRIADELAGEGYSVMIPDIFSRGSWFSCVRKVMAEMKAGTGPGIQDLIAGRNWLPAPNRARCQFREFLIPQRRARPRHQSPCRA